MPQAKKEQNRKQKSLISILLILSILETILTFIWIINIPTDPKNSIFLGFSLQRLVLLGLVIVIGLFLVFLLNRKEGVVSLVNKSLKNKALDKTINITGLVVFTLFWFTLWLPPDRLDLFAARFVRIKPVLFLVELVLLQLFLYIKFAYPNKNISLLIKKLTQNKRLVFIYFIVITSFLLIFIALNQVRSSSLLGSLVAPPESIVLPMQVFLAVVLFTFVILIRNKEEKPQPKLSKRRLILFIGIWLFTLAAWQLSPLPCTDDRPGPYLPNDQCYPEVDDAVHSIGSIYTNLGQGINNGWLTDKPMYMLFLTIGQWIFGPRIDHYLIFQIIMIAFLPALLYLVTSSLLGNSVGLLSAALAMLKGINEIILYKVYGAVNVKLSLSEPFVALLLMVFCISVVYWIKKPKGYQWAITSSGLLGATILTRFNALALIPLILGGYLLLNLKQWRTAIKQCAIFMTVLVLTLLPWLITAKENGESFYLVKIRNVIESRYEDEGSSLNFESNSPNLAKIMPPKEISILQNPPLGAVEQAVVSSGIQGAAFHLLNNVYSAFAEFPLNFRMLTGQSVADQSLWNFEETKSIWSNVLSTENLFLLLINFALYMLGVFLAVKKLGWAGLTALVIQLGYFAGNALSMTSGGRYLTPVSWATLIYTSLGIGGFIMGLVNFQVLKKYLDAPVFLNKIKHSSTPHLINGIMVFIFLMIGMSLYLVNFLPSQLPSETGADVIEEAYTRLKDNADTIPAELENFLNDPKTVVVRGKAYHPRYYRSTMYYPGNPLFEVLVFGEDNLYISHMLYTKPDQYFSDKSDVIIVGCKVGEDTLWAAHRKFINTFAIIQLDHEGALYLGQQTKWSCSH